MLIKYKSKVKKLHKTKCKMLQIQTQI